MKSLDLIAKAFVMLLLVMVIGRHGGVDADSQRKMPRLSSDFKIKTMPSLPQRDIYHECIHHIIRNDSEVTTQRQRYSSARIGSPLLHENSSPIRIEFDLTYVDPAKDEKYACVKVGDTYFNTKFRTDMTCTADDVVVNSDIIANVLEDARNFLKSALRVIPVMGDLSFSRASCSQIQLQNAVYKDADIALMIFVRPTTNTTLAFASYCSQDQTGRPILGYVNFGPRTINSVKQNTPDYKRLLATTIHEIIHALGFSIPASTDAKNDIMRPTSMSMWDPVSQKKVSYNFKMISLPGPRVIYVMDTPSVLAKVREHFGCTTIPGAPIEDANLPGTGGTHWEESLFMNEALTGSLDALIPSSFSALTLAFLSDTGWYAVNYQMAEPLEYGRGLGCDFFNSRCDHWTGGYICQKDKELSCSADSRYKAICSLAKYSEPLPTKYQYFTDPTLGGLSQTTDYCPIPSPYEGCQDTTTPSLEASIYRGIRGEKYCQDCYCFMGNTKVGGSLLNDYKDSMFQSMPFACYEAVCAGPFQLKVRPGAQTQIWYDCPTGEKIQMYGYTGSLTCPNASSICSGKPFENDWPVITSISPNKFHDDGGQLFTIYGHKLSLAVDVHVADGKATVKEIHDDKIIAVSPPVNSPSGDDFYAPVYVFTADPKRKTGQIFDQVSHD
eukprot:TRINITY_DN2042_c0_g1_i10.p1 TRINITY_DN2042_c0_g1~~TRINITY_DN2042_c0_g1_i10.p1  ORF type:complete len:668 (+),score=88.44 TRINITY_DN2042_c0_g1_i10:102-2105(+)